VVNSCFSVFSRRIRDDAPYPAQWLQGSSPPVGRTILGPPVVSSCFSVFSRRIRDDAPYRSLRLKAGNGQRRPDA
jgi:hypothetical protein